MPRPSYQSVKRFFIGEPFPTSAAAHERLDKLRGLAVFASDPISSNAYATEAIMQVLVVMGSVALGLTLPIAAAIALLVALVVSSYRQTIYHYPLGGGAYSVSQDNLGTNAGLIAGAALLTDYILTVSVSVSAGVRAITSAYPELNPERVLIALALLVALTVINLRGVRESGTIFAFPTYAFVGGVLVVLLIGFARYFEVLGASPLPPHPVNVPAEVSPIGIAYAWILLRAFAAGCTALTGIEAISDGVAAFKAPEAKNAATTMLVMGVMAMTLFLGISFMATHMSLVPEESESILSQMARSITSDIPGGGLMYLWVQAFTALILILAANTGYQDFPRLSFFLAKDGFLPRWMQNRGDRLVFSSGIIVLTVAAAALIVFFRADEIAMLPLYAIGVMISFTLSQAGMVRLWNRIERLAPGESEDIGHTTIHLESGTTLKKSVNAVGAVVTFVVLVVLLATKFLEGAWVLVLVIPGLVLLFKGIRRHYVGVAQALSTRGLEVGDLADIADVAVVPIADVHRGTLRALKYASKLSTDVRAVIIVTDEAQRERIQRRWDRFPEITSDLKLIMIDYEYRDILDPLVEYIDKVNHGEFPGRLVTVVVPEFVPRSASEQLLHNQTANLLRLRLRAQPDVVVIDVPYHIR